MAASHDPAQLSPKVKQPGIAAIIVFAVLTIIAGFAEAINQEQLEGLGIWAGPVGAAITSAVMLWRGYQALDPLRQDTDNQIETLKLALAEKDRELDRARYAPFTEEETVVSDPVSYDPPNDLKG